MADLDAELKSMGLGEMPDRVSEVLPGQLYLGNKWEAQSNMLRRKYGITHVLTVCPDVADMDKVLSKSTGSDIKGLSNPRHLIVNVEDYETADLLGHLADTFEFIDAAITTGGRVFVHCALGISRSPTVVAAYLIRKRGLSTTEALDVIRKARDYIMPNDGFLEQLDKYALQTNGPKFLPLA